MANQFTKRRQTRHMDETRDKIQATQIVNRLHNCVMGKVDLTPQQVAAAKTLLAKVLPDLQSAELNVETTERRVVSAKPMSDDEWSREYENSVVAAAGAAESIN